MGGRSAGKTFGSRLALEFLQFLQRSVSVIADDGESSGDFGFGLDHFGQQITVSGNDGEFIRDVVEDQIARFPTFLLPRHNFPVQRQSRMRENVEAYTKGSGMLRNPN